MAEERVEVLPRGEGFAASVRHECGHVYESRSLWNTEVAAQRHGDVLVKLACSACRSGRRR